MGNCFFGGGGEGGAIRVITSTGAILEFCLPITAGCITAEFPGHALFPSQDLFWTPLSLHHHLRPGHSYYLLPLNPTTYPIPNPNSAPNFPITSLKKSTSSSISAVREGHVRSKSSPSSLSATLTPYRMSLDSNRHHHGGAALKRSYTDAAISGSGSSNAVNYQQETGFWKVKLVITPDQLLQILSQEGSTHDLIHNVTAVAKCGGYSSSLAASSSSSESSAASSVGELSDEWINTSNAIRSNA
ncbi:hypothetical protein LINPERHAP2_LOCUS33372 [Linum perenne]